jgi:hypothetical protein
MKYVVTKCKNCKKSSKEIKELSNERFKQVGDKGIGIMEREGLCIFANMFCQCRAYNPKPDITERLKESAFILEGLDNLRR